MPTRRLSQSETLRVLSPARMANYQTAAQGSFDDVIALYEWNVLVSAAFFESMHYFEISLRNVMDGALAHYAAGLDSSGIPWYRHPKISLNEKTVGIIRSAIFRATIPGSPELSGRVVAELSLGFWSKLLSESYHVILWAPALKGAFPNARRAKLHSSVEDLMRLRNRIAHHEPIHDRDLQQAYSNLPRLSERIVPGLELWIADTSRIPSTLLQRPI